MKPEVVCQHRIEIEGKIFCQKKKEFISQPYLCSLNQCKDCQFPTLAMVQISVGRCDQCPFHDITRTIGAGDAYDYYCKVKNRKIMGYVEYRDELPPVPSWCPFYIKESLDR